MRDGGAAVVAGSGLFVIWRERSLRHKEQAAPKANLIAFS
jgi:hypothetical protein